MVRPAFRTRLLSLAAAGALAVALAAPFGFTAVHADGLGEETEEGAVATAKEVSDHEVADPLPPPTISAGS